ncbi:MAG: PspC domain-containing protein [Undibacterium sp.]|nr:PspC domain-containing protein [Opitutaceae bacterium]
MNIIKEAFGSEAWRKLRELTLPEDGMVAGVCTGLGRATPLAAWMWRVLFIAATLAWGVGLAAYIILMISVPDAE